jgi:LPXTG-site transpeptidase (sortase) family protein
MARTKGILAAVLVVAGLSGLVWSATGLWDQPHQPRLPPTTEAAIHRAIEPQHPVGPAPVAAGPSGQPIELALSSLGETAPVVSVTPRQGVLEPPNSPSVLAWSSVSSPAGAASGTTLIVGHINWAGQSGVFSNLAALKSGDSVKVDIGTSWLSYRVVDSGEYLKGSLPASVFATAGSPALALVTCGGTFNSTTGHYDDNVVVMAVPVTPTQMPGWPWPATLPLP